MRCQANQRAAFYQVGLLAAALLAALSPAALAQVAQTNPAPTLAATAAALAQLSFDPAACYRIRDVALDRGDLRLFFTDGWIIFAKPLTAAGDTRSIAALYWGASSGDDAEVSVLPPSTGERISLARFAGTPNLNEHLDSALLLFTDDTAAELRQSIAGSNHPDPSPEQGLLFQQRFDALLRNFATSLRLRLMENLLNGRAGPEGFFYAAIGGRKRGAFDALFDPAAPRQNLLGQLTQRAGHGYYDVWTTFPSRAGRNKPSSTPVYTVAATQIDARLDADLAMSATATSTFTVNRDTRILVFDLSPRLQLSAVSVDGLPAEPFQPPSTGTDLARPPETAQFLVMPPRTVSAGQPHQIQFTYAGNVITQMGDDVYTVGSRGSWYPVSGVQFSRYDITFTYPDSLELVFPGVVKEQSAEAGHKRVRRVVDQPIRMAGFNIGRYVSKQVVRGGLTVNVYANRGVEKALQQPVPTPILIPNAPSYSRAIPRHDVVIVPPVSPAPDPLGRLNDLAGDVASAFEFYAQNYGPPALPELMVSPIPGTFGQGFPGLVYLSTLAYFSPVERPETARTQSSQLFFSETLHAHETAHQWWGNVVTTAGESDEWLMEALASYSSLMVLEKRKGPKALNSAFDQYRDHLLTPAEPVPSNDSREVPSPTEGAVTVPAAKASRESIGPLRLGSRLDNSLAPNAWAAVIYEKGAWVMHMLRRRMGDAAFTAFLKDFATEHRYQTVTTEQFFAEAARHMPAETAGKPTLDRHLESFVESWVESTGIPKLTLQTQVRGKAPNLRLTVTVKQSEVNDRFTTVVPVEVQLPGAKPRTIWLETGPDPVSETIAIPVHPAKVTLDPDGAVLKR